MKRTFKWMSERITGVSCPFFGISWTPSDSERNAVRKLLVYLEDRRILHLNNERLFVAQRHHMSYGKWVIDSVLQIRERVTKTLEEAEFPRESASVLESMRKDCRTFLNKPRQVGRMSVVAIGRLRVGFGENIAKLCVMHGLDIDGELALLVKRTQEFLEQKDEKKWTPKRCP